MSVPDNPQAVKHFVQHTLGCTCPDSVFESQDIEREAALNDAPFKKLVVGERLLIYLIGIDSVADWHTHMAPLISAGINERNARGLNRFRLVLGVDDTEAVNDEAVRLFEGLKGIDDKVHLHVVSIGALGQVE